MSNNDIQQLLKRLKELQLEEQKIISALEEALSSGTLRSPASPAVPSVVIEDNSPRSIKIGDRVRILNETRKSGLGLILGTNYNSDQDRLATVYDVVGKRIYFQTDNGQKTWRYAKNLHRIE
jgi:hypothetical protein